MNSHLVLHTRYERNGVDRSIQRVDVGIGWHWSNDVGPREGTGIDEEYIRVEDQGVCAFVENGYLRWICGYLLGLLLVDDTDRSSAIKIEVKARARVPDKVC